MSSKKTCSICLEDSYLVAYAACRHFMCAACCWTLREIVGDFKCPICRDELPWVVLSRYPFNEFQNENELREMMIRPQSTAFFRILDVNMYGSRQDIDAANAIRAPQCTQCKVTFDTIHSMSKHHQDVHKLRFCYVCVEYLKKLPKDYELYRACDLSVHLKIHPKCVLCDKYVLNESVLRSHRKTCHFQCEVCDRINKVSVFNTHNELSEHFKNYHFLCEYGECARFGLSVFPSKIEYNRHLVRQHTSLFSKEQRKRLLDFSNEDFLQYSQPNAADESNPTVEARHHRTPSTASSRNNQGNIIDIVNEMRIAEDMVSEQHSLLLNDDNFPHLNSLSRRIEAELPLTNLPATRLTKISKSKGPSRSVYPRMDSSTNNDFPNLLPSSVATSERSNISTSTRNVPFNITRHIVNGSDSTSHDPQQEFPSFPILKGQKFPGESWWDKAPKASWTKKPKYQAPPINLPPKNELAYSLGIRNLDVITENNKKRKKKRKKSSKFSTGEGVIEKPHIEENGFLARNEKSVNSFNILDSRPKNTSESKVELLNNAQLDLYQMVRIACNGDDLTLANFMQICANFARGHLTALEFHAKAVDIVGNDTFFKILPKLAEEMPDESKSKSLINLKNGSPPLSNHDSFDSKKNAKR